MIGKTLTGLVSGSAQLAVRYSLRQAVSNYMPQESIHYAETRAPFEAYSSLRSLETNYSAG